MRRLLRYRLVVPVLRGKHEPEHTARGVMFGLMAAMTPTVGVQMPLVLALWLALRVVNRSWDFNLLVAMAWTWVTNILTVPPIYYTFLLTGQIMMGRWGQDNGYGEFQRRLGELLRTDTDIFETMWIYVVGIFDLWGVPMFVGCVPWAIVFSWLGYRWSLNMVRRFRMRRLQRTVSTR